MIFVDILISLVLLLWCFTSQITTLPSDMMSSSTARKLIQNLDDESLKVMDYLIKQEISRMKEDERGFQELLNENKQNTAIDDTYLSNSGDEDFGDKLYLNPEDIGDERIRNFMLQLFKITSRDMSPVPLPWRQKMIPNTQCIPIDGIKRYHCPSPDPETNKWSCISDLQLCDGMKHCPNNEDEDTTNCMFYQVMKTNVDVMMQNIDWFSQAIKGLKEKLEILDDSTFKK